MPCAAMPFATPCARPIATSMGLVLSWAGSWKSATQAPYPANAGIPGSMPFAAKREAAAVPVEPGSEVLRTEVQVTWELAQ